MTDTDRANRATQPKLKGDRKSLGRRLREAREYLDLSQDEVAQILDVPRTAISLIEAGRRRVDVIELQKLAEIYQCSVGYITGEDNAASQAAKSVAHLARAAQKLTDRDRDELIRFAEFLQAKNRP